ncbi:MAG TPA: hypothetical protein VK066_20075 [Chloroflexota bacterium]|nr:hypothetical protein [Chloroflexota bacterium]
MDLTATRQLDLLPRRQPLTIRRDGAGRYWGECPAGHRLPLSALEATHRQMEPCPACCAELLGW